MGHPQKNKEGVTANIPLKTVNIDLCFVPETYIPTDQTAEKSSNDTKKEASVENETVNKIRYAGEIFKDENLTYEVKMDKYVALRKEQKENKEKEKQERHKISEVNKKEENLRIERRKIREIRNREEEQWRKFREERSKYNTDYKKLSRKEKKRLKREREIKDREWKEKKEERNKTIEKRQEEDEKWRKRREEIRKEKQEFGMLTKALVTILMVMDNCTRKWLALPLFLAGRKVRVFEIVQALKEVLPKELKYLISDNGKQFIAELFQKMCIEQNFVHVRITPHRPQTNGIPERAIRTLKKMLFSKGWKDPTELEDVLSSTIGEYNDRPHQGKELNGLSPNEYERRLLIVRRLLNVA